MSSSCSNNSKKDESMSDSSKDESEDPLETEKIYIQSESEEIKTNNLIQKISKILKKFMSNYKENINNNTSPNPNPNGNLIIFSKFIK